MLGSLPDRRALRPAAAAAGSRRRACYNERKQGAAINKRYTQEAARLAKLPRAERFEELIDFPARHLFKVIGLRDGLSDAVQAALRRLGYADVILVERPSAKGRYASLTFHLQVANGVSLDAVYTELEGLPGLSCLL